MATPSIASASSPSLGKLGASRIETVRGLGYRLTPLAGEAEDLRAASSEGVSTVDLGVDRVMDQVNQFVATPASVETLWLGAALAAIALAFAVTRLVEEF